MSELLITQPNVSLAFTPFPSAIGDNMQAPNSLFHRDLIIENLSYVTYLTSVVSRCFKLECRAMTAWGFQPTTFAGSAKTGYLVQYKRFVCTSSPLIAQLCC